MPLTVQTLYGLSPLGAGYFTSLLSLTWTVTALWSESLPSHRVRTVILLGPVAVSCGVAAGCLTGLTLRFLWLYRKENVTTSDATGH
jgi:hypothetical protein